MLVVSGTVSAVVYNRIRSGCGSEDVVGVTSPRTVYPKVTFWPGETGEKLGFGKLVQLDVKYDAVSEDGVVALAILFGAVSVVVVESGGESLICFATASPPTTIPAMTRLKLLIIITLIKHRKCTKESALRKWQKASRTRRKYFSSAVGKTSD